MAAARVLLCLDRVIWVLIYGGLFALILGVVIDRAGDGTLGWSLMVGGSVAAGAGVVLIAVRSRLPPGPQG